MTEAPPRPALSRPAPPRPSPGTRPAGAPAGRLLAGVHPGGGYLDYQQHLDTHGPLPRFRRPAPAGALVAAVAAAGLRGRGGAGYPLAAKLAAAAGQPGPRVVVVNAAESEPASSKDAVLVGTVPHLVLDGATAAADAVGADEIVVWLHRDPAAPPAPIALAAAERSRAGVDEVFVRIEYGPPRYVAGEASAVVSRLSGGPARPRLTPPHATERGVLRRPTVLANAETLAHLALLARHGPAWFRSVGSPDEAGTLLLTVVGGVHQPLVVEVPFGTRVSDVVAVSEPAGPPVAVLTGGYGGSWLPWSRAAGLPVSSRAFRAAGGTLGVGLLAVLPAGRCGLAETAPLVDWLAGENAGQCGPCVNGLPAIAGAFAQLAGRPHDAGRPYGRPPPDVVGRLHRWSAMVTGRGLCHHPDGVGRLVRSALQVFAPEVDAHLAGRPCPGHPLRPLFPVPARPAAGELDRWR